MANIKLVYIDKDKWEDETDLFRLKHDLDSDVCHEFVYYNNVVSLEHDSKDRTICTLSNLSTSIEKKIAQNYEVFILTGFGITLEYIFLNLLNIAKTKDVDICILDKSKFPIRSNVSMTINLDEYDTTTDFNSIKDILEKNLNDSLENARKSKKPEHANDLGISVKEEKNNSSLSMLFSSLGLYDFIDEYEELEREYYDFEEGDEEINELLEALLSDDGEKDHTDNADLNLGIKINNNIYEISDKENTIRLDKKAIIKLSRMLEVLVND